MTTFYDLFIDADPARPAIDQPLEHIYLPTATAYRALERCAFGVAITRAACTRPDTDLPWVLSSPTRACRSSVGVRGIYRLPARSAAAVAGSVGGAVAPAWWAGGAVLPAARVRVKSLRTLRGQALRVDTAARTAGKRPGGTSPSPRRTAHITEDTMSSEIIPGVDTMALAEQAWHGYGTLSTHDLAAAADRRLDWRTVAPVTA